MNETRVVELTTRIAEKAQQLRQRLEQTPRDEGARKDFYALRRSVRALEFELEEERDTLGEAC